MIKCLWFFYLIKAEIINWTTGPNKWLLDMTIMWSEWLKMLFFIPLYFLIICLFNNFIFVLLFLTIGSWSLLFFSQIYKIGQHLKIAFIFIFKMLTKNVNLTESKKWGLTVETRRQEHIFRNKKKVVKKKHFTNLFHVLAHQPAGLVHASHTLYLYQMKSEQ